MLKTKWVHAGPNAKPAQQKDFTETEAIAICEMLSVLCEDDYEVQIEPANGEDEDGNRIAVYQVSVIETDDTIIAEAITYRLVDALREAYQMTSEYRHRSGEAEDD